MNNSRYEVRKYYTTFTDNRDEAIDIARGIKIDAIWQEQFEVIDWGTDIDIYGNCRQHTNADCGNARDEESAADQ